MCEPYRAFITEQLRLRRNDTAIYQELVDQFGFVAGYNSVKRFAGTAVAKEPEQFDRLEFAPGEEVQVDYGEGAMTRVPGTDRYRRPRLFVMTMRYSRRSFRRVVWESSQQTWARLHEQAWRYFGGSCAYVVLDNRKEGVIKPNLYEPELNPVYRNVLAHYGVVADPARVYSEDPVRTGLFLFQLSVGGAMNEFVFSADDVFILQQRGIVFRGEVVGGSVSTGERVSLSVRRGELTAIVGLIDVGGKPVPTSIAGVEMGLLLTNFDREAVNDRILIHVDESNCDDVPSVECILDIDLPAIVRTVSR